MIRIVLLVVLALLAFVLSMVGALAATGNLNAEALQRLTTGAAAPPEALGPATALGPLARQLQEKEQQLNQREQELALREQQLDARMRELQQLQSQLEQLDSELEDKLTTGDAESAQRQKTVANTLAEMRASNAAERLEGLPIDEIASILRLIEDEGDRAKIIEEMEPATATQVLRALQAPAI